MDQSVSQSSNGAIGAGQGQKAREGNGEVKKRAVGVTLPPRGRPSKVQGDTPADFTTIVQSSALTWVNFTCRDLEAEGPQLAAAFGFSESIIPALLKGYMASFDDRDYELGMMLPAVRVKKADLKTYPLIILVRKGLILTLHPEVVVRLINFSRYAEAFARKLPENMPPEDKLTLMLARIIDENNSRNFEQLREIEEQADMLSECLVDSKADRKHLGRSIYEMKHTLIVYLNTLWYTLDVLNNLRYGDADLITDNTKVLAKINLLVTDVTQQISLSEHMSEVLASGLEVMQSIYNNQLQVLNNRMALTMTWLTILGTAVLVPNTLATVGGLLHLEGNALLAFMVLMAVSTVQATVLAWWWVTKKVNIPSKADEWCPGKDPL